MIHLKNKNRLSISLHNSKVDDLVLFCFMEAALLNFELYSSHEYVQTFNCTHFALFSLDSFRQLAVFFEIDFLAEMLLPRNIQYSISLRQNIVLAILGQQL